ARDTGATYGLACAIDARNRPRYACFSLTRHLRPHLVFGSILTRLGHHGIDLVAFFKPLRGPLSGFLLLALLYQLFDLVQGALDSSDAAIGWCQRARTDPGRRRGVDRPL